MADAETMKATYAGLMEALGTGDIGAFERSLTDDYVWHGNAGEDRQGRGDRDGPGLHDRVSRHGLLGAEHDGRRGHASRDVVGERHELRSVRRSASDRRCIFSSFWVVGQELGWLSGACGTSRASGAISSSFGSSFCFIKQSPSMFSAAASGSARYTFDSKVGLDPAVAGASRVNLTEKS